MNESKVLLHIHVEIISPCIMFIMMPYPFEGSSDSYT